MRRDLANGRHRDPFMNWYEQWIGDNPRPLQFRILVILINARFDQGTRAERALENTRRLVDVGILDADSIPLEDVPILHTRQRMKPDKWRELLWRSLPGLKQLARRITSFGRWKASDLRKEITIAKIPWFGPKTARLAVRWIAELVGEISVGMADSEVPVDSLIYRVAARLALLDPNSDKYWGPGSPGHQKVQQIARQLFPHNPSLVDEPIWMMGRQPRDKGFSSPKTQFVIVDACLQPSARDASKSPILGSLATQVE